MTLPARSAVVPSRRRSRFVAATSPPPVAGCTTTPHVRGLALCCQSRRMRAACAFVRATALPRLLHRTAGLLRRLLRGFAQLLLHLMRALFDLLRTCAYLGRHLVRLLAHDLIEGLLKLTHLFVRLPHEAEGLVGTRFHKLGDLTLIFLGVE